LQKKRGVWEGEMRKKSESESMGEQKKKKSTMSGKVCDWEYAQDVIETIPRSFQSIMDGMVRFFKHYSLFVVLLWILPPFY
jgi:hypothetical protein